jgi:hypothetical protein
MIVISAHASTEEEPLTPAELQTQADLMEIRRLAKLYPPFPPSFWDTSDDEICTVKTPLLKKPREKPAKRKEDTPTTLTSKRFDARVAFFGAALALLYHSIKTMGFFDTQYDLQNLMIALFYFLPVVMIYAKQEAEVGRRFRRQKM